MHVKLPCNVENHLFEEKWETWKLQSNIQDILFDHVDTLYALEIVVGCRGHFSPP